MEEGNKIARTYNPQKRQKYPVISNANQANKIIDQILLHDSLVIGIDIEAAVEMSRFGILCLLQIAFNNSAYIFDMTQMNPDDIKLKELFSRRKIVKVFHDCIEDVSLLYNLCNIKELKGIFDTQIAHRMCFEDTYAHFGVNNQHSSLSLATLIKGYLNIEYELKGEMHNLMAQNPYLWKTRPLPEKLNIYAGNDVIYLPKIYEIIYNRCEKRFFKHITMSKIFCECNKYLDYVKINLNIKNFNKMNISKGEIIQGLIKNFQSYCVFVQLNIGYVGVVLNKKSVETLRNRYALGDIIYFRVMELDPNKKRYILDYYDGEIEKEEDKENSFSLTKKLNVCEKSFYPQSYLRFVDKMKVDRKNEKDLKDLNRTQIMSRKDVSVFDVLNSIMPNK